MCVVSDTFFHASVWCVGAQLPNFLWWRQSPSAFAVSLSTVRQMWLALRLLQKTLPWLEQLSLKRTIAMLTELPKESLASLQPASSQLMFGFPVEPAQRQRILFAPCKRARAGAHLPLELSSPPLPSPPAASAFRPRQHTDTRRVGRRQPAREVLRRLRGSLAICFCEQPLLMGWDFGNVNSELVCPGLPIFFPPHLTASQNWVG